MTHSPLATGTVPHHGKYGSRDGRPITRVIQHHWAGPGGDARLANPTQQASSSYLIYSDGTIKAQVPEEFRPWTSGSYEADVSAITIEVENISYQKHGDDSHPDSWAISDAAYNSIIRLLADVASRHGWGSITPDRYRGHREFSPTACPGGFLWSRLGDIRSRANTILQGGGISLAGSPTTKEGPMFGPYDPIFTGIDGNKVSLEGQLRSIDTKTTNALAEAREATKTAFAALTAVNSLLSIRFADPSDQTKNYTLPEYIVWGATNAKIAAGNSAVGVKQTSPEALAAAMLDGAAGLTAQSVADQLRIVADAAPKLAEYVEATEEDTK